MPAREAGVDRRARPARTSSRASGAERVNRHAEGGRASGVTGTPAFFANGVRVEGSFDAQSLLAALERGE